MNNTKISVDIEFYSKNISIIEIWERVEKYLLLHLNKNNTIKLGEKSYKIKNISNKIKYKDIFIAQWEQIYFCFTYSGQYKFSRIIGGCATDEGGFSSIEEAENFIEYFADMKEFKKAVVQDAGYTVYQLSDDPESYDKKGWYYDPDKLISNGAPFPVNKMIIDTSNNPGRCIWRFEGENGCESFLENMGNPTWVSHRFIDEWNCNIDKLKENGFICSDVGSAIKIVSPHGNKPYTSADNADQQEHLRKYLYLMK